MSQPEVEQWLERRTSQLIGRILRAREDHLPENPEETRRQVVAEVHGFSEDIGEVIELLTHGGTLVNGLVLERIDRSRALTQREHRARRAIAGNGRR